MKAHHEIMPPSTAIIEQIIELVATKFLSGDLLIDCLGGHDYIAQQLEEKSLHHDISNVAALISILSDPNADAEFTMLQRAIQRVIDLDDELTQIFDLLQHGSFANNARVLIKLLHIDDLNRFFRLLQWLNDFNQLHEKIITYFLDCPVEKHGVYLNIFTILHPIFSTTPNMIRAFFLGMTQRNPDDLYEDLLFLECHRLFTPEKILFFLEDNIAHELYLARKFLKKNKLLNYQNIERITNSKSPLKAANMLVYNYLLPIMELRFIQPILTIVFDIDEVICSQSSLQNHPRETLFFARCASIVWAAKMVHYIFPGVKELIKAILSYENTHILFFSAAGSIRNKTLVTSLFEIIFGEDGLKRHASRVSVCSSNHRKKIANFHQQELKRKYNLSSGKYVKDFIPYLKHGACVKNTIFFDDLSANVAYGQAKNYVPISPVYSTTFRDVAISPKIQVDDECDLSNPLLQQVNVAFFMAGVIKRCLDNIDHQFATDILFAMNYYECPVSKLPMLNKDNMRDESVYQEGLTFLKSSRRNIGFVTKQYIKQESERPITDREYLMLDNLGRHRPRI